ncbi:MAG TPA: abortive phage infection protein [Oscillospiraceae bacterium]|nr:abortive phage infection protein [Oscillospiraceae bacterium]HPS35626.1 abortive phage infection protein [Oscillospiraceae bacterium]
MKKKETAKKIISEAGGIAKTAQLITAGLSKSDVAFLCHGGFIQRIRHGYYQLSEKNDVREEQLLAALLPEGIVCAESALFHYGYSDFAPRKWSIAVPRSIAKVKSKIDAVPVKIYYIQKGQYQLGKKTSDFNGVTLAIYDRERTICDCFKYRTKLDNELFGKAMNAYAADDQKNLANLSKYAKEMKLYKKVAELMEVLLG